MSRAAARASSLFARLLAPLLHLLPPSYRASFASLPSFPLLPLCARPRAKSGDSGGATRGAKAKPLWRRALGPALALALVLLLTFNRCFLFALVFGVAPGRFSVAPHAADTRLRDVVTVASIFKNEGRYMREWLEHHLALGVDSFLLFDDTAPGDPFPAGKVLQPYIRSGVVELVRASQAYDGRMFFLSSGWSVAQAERYKSMPWHLFFHSKQQRALVEAYHRLLDRASPLHHHWIALLDIDEFYNPHGGDLRALLRAQRLRGARTVHMGKLDFGPSAVERRPQDGLVRPHYIYRDAVPERVASITLVRAITGMAPYCVHTFEVNSLVGDLLFGGADCNRWPGNHMGGQLRRHIYYAPPDELAVHHYKTKSLEECCEHQNVVSVNSMRIKDRRCHPAAMADVCDDSMMQYVEGLEDSRPCSTQPSPFGAAKAGAGHTTAAPSPATPFYRFCQQLQAEIEAEQAAAARLRAAERHLHQRAPRRGRK